RRAPPGFQIGGVQVEQPADVLAVPQLFVVPACEERGENRVQARSRDQQVGEVEGDVVLDVHHVVKAEEVAPGEWAGGDLLPLDAGDIDLPRLFLVTLDAEAHINPYESVSALDQRTKPTHSLFPRPSERPSPV